MIKKERKWFEPLEICKFCIELYNIQFKDQKNKQNFSLKEYIKKPINYSYFLNIPIDFCTIPNSYTTNWKAISQTIKRQHKYLCFTCGKDFSKPECRRFLHTHHINADKKDNTRDNLQVLCIECHSKEHNHSHIKQSKDYQEYLNSHCYQQRNKYEIQ